MWKAPPHNDRSAHHFEPRGVPKLDRGLSPSIRSRREIVESRPKRLQYGREPYRTERWTSSPAEFWDRTGLGRRRPLGSEPPDYNSSQSHAAVEQIAQGQ